MKERAGKPEYPVKVIRFEDEKHPHAFADYMVDVANRNGLFDGGIIVVKAGHVSLPDTHKRYGSFYNTLISGSFADGSRALPSVEKTLDCRADYAEFIALSRLNTLRFIISDFTGRIVFKENDHFDGIPETYPGILTKILYYRYAAFSGDKDKGLVVLPLDIEPNGGEKLRECVLALSRVWHLPKGFAEWVNNANTFCTAFADRNAQSSVLVIASNDDISCELPLHKAGFPVTFRSKTTLI